MPLTVYTANRVLDHLLRTASWTQPSNIYVGLLSNVGSQTELASTGGYARVQRNTWPAASGGLVSNDAEITFAVASADWAQAVGVGVYDAITGGNLLAYGTLTTPRTVTNGVVARFPIGDIDWTVATT